MKSITKRRALSLNLKTDRRQTMEAKFKYVLQTRRRILVNTDPQRRCYEGAHAKSELVWSDWEDLHYFYERDQDDFDQKMNFWQFLNDTAVSDRGEEARREFRIAPCN